MLSVWFKPEGVADTIMYDAMMEVEPPPVLCSNPVMRSAQHIYGIVRLH